VGGLRDVELVALLDEPVRRRLYAYLRERGDTIGRDEAARAAGISRSLAAFHLDRMAGAGLLDVDYRRVGGRSGRGAGRPAKLYRLSERRLEVSIPETRYALAGRILLGGLQERRDGESPATAARRAGREAGRELGRRIAERGRGGDPLRRTYRVLREQGYEPVRRQGTVLLRNCPFHEVMRVRPDVVCAMNLGFLHGLVSELAGAGLRAEPVSEPGYCCVAIEGAREAR